MDIFKSIFILGNLTGAGGLCLWFGEYEASIIFFLLAVITEVYINIRTRRRLEPV